MSFDFSKFVDDVLAEIVMSEDETAFLKALFHSAGRYPDFARILQENPAVESNLINAANRAFGSRVGDIITSTEVALGMMGFIPARNYLAASIIKRNHYIDPWDDSVKLILRYALEGELHGGALAPRYFSAGLVFDFVLNALIKPDQEGNLPATPKFVADTWRHSLQVCAVARQLVNRLFATMELEKDICVHAILHDIGKIIFYLMDDTLYTSQMRAQLAREIKEAAGEKPGPSEGGASGGVPFVDCSLICFPERSWSAETEKYGLSHDLIGHLVLWTLGFLPDTSWITLYHHQPFLAARRGSAVHLHTTIIWLADQVCRYREAHHVSNLGDSMISGWYNVIKPFLLDKKVNNFWSVVKTLIYS